MQQFYSYAIRSQTVLSKLKVTGRAYNGSAYMVLAVVLVALPPCSINLIYKLLGSLLLVVLFSKKS